MILNTVKEICTYIWSLFIRGLLTILPIVITIGFFYLTLEFIARWLKPLQQLQPLFLRQLPYSEIIFAVTIILLIGTVLKTFVVRSLMRILESLLFQIPLIKPVYSGVKQLVNAFNPHPNDPIAFKRVVIIEFPCKNVYSLGFLTTEVTESMAPRPNEQFFNVFIPTTPNPTSGYFVMVPSSGIKITKLTRQEAMAIIISGGIIQPTHQEQILSKKI